MSPLPRVQAASLRRGLFLLFPALILAAATARADTDLNLPGHRIAWHDEFEGTAVDRTRWDVSEGANAWYQRASDGRFVEPQWFNEPFSPWLQAGTINDERQYYSPNNVTVQGGVLAIEARRESVANPVGVYSPNYHRYTSGKLNTADEFRFSYGVVRWRAKLPAGQGMWPALWLLNAPNPWYWDDEIDVMEARGSAPTITTSAHHYKVGANRENRYNSGSLDTGVNLQAGFHEYGLEWTPGRIRTDINGNTVLVDTVAVPTGPMFLIMNAAVGGHFDGVPASDAIFPTTFSIDWVRVWQPSPWPSDLADGGFETPQGKQWPNWDTRDDGNLAGVTTGALHGAASVRIARRVAHVPLDPTVPNLLVDGTAGPWSAWLNQLSSGGDVTSGSSITVASIPATASGDAVTLRVHQTAPSPGANAVVFRQVDGAKSRGLTLDFSGSVAIEQALPAGTDAVAFIRVFRGDYSFVDTKVSVKAGGPFSLRATIPATDVPFVQVGLETSGPTGSAGRLAATGLRLVDTARLAPPDTGSSTGFDQVVAARPGLAVRYGLLASNDPATPLLPGAAGRLRLAFLDAGNAVIGEVVTLLVDATSPASAAAWSLEHATPAGAAWARFTVERFASDPANDPAGSFLADAAFLQVPGYTALPVFTTVPRREIVVREGDPVLIDVTVTSPDAVSWQWYHRGAKAGTTEDVSLVATKADAGRRFAVATNAAGPVVGAITDLVVLDAGPDSDGDGISDADETQVYGTLPSAADSDRDGISDYAELFVARTSPTDAASALRATALGIVGDELELAVATVPGVTYRIVASTDLGAWEPIGEPFVATAASTTRRVTMPGGETTTRFYRVEVLP